MGRARGGTLADPPSGSRVLVAGPGQAVWLRHPNLALIPAVIRRRSRTRRMRLVVDLEPGYSIRGQTSFVVPRSALRRRNAEPLAISRSARVGFRPTSAPVTVHHLTIVEAGDGRRPA